MRKQLTAEQKAKSAERKERFKELCRKFSAMSPEERAKWADEAGAVVNLAGHALSLRNTLLCYFQRRDVSMVGGFRQWLGAGRCVRKGEHGMSILVPIGGGRDEETGDVESPHFIAASVFDISQTDELPVVESGAVVESGVAS